MYIFYFIFFKEFNIYILLYLHLKACLLLNKFVKKLLLKNMYTFYFIFFKEFSIYILLYLHLKTCLLLNKFVKKLLHNAFTMVTSYHLQRLILMLPLLVLEILPKVISPHIDSSGCKKYFFPYKKFLICYSFFFFFLFYDKNQAFVMIFLYIKKSSFRDKIFIYGKKSCLTT